MPRSSLLCAFLVVFLDLVGVGMLVPVLPYYAQSMGAHGWELGLLVSLFTLVQFAAIPFWGKFSDRVGRRPVLVMSLLGSSLALVILMLSGSLHWIFISRIIAGCFAATVSLSYAYIADVTEPAERGKGLGMISAGIGLGITFGTVIGGLLARYGFWLPLSAAALLGVFNAVFVFFKVEETRQSREVRRSHRIRVFELKVFRNLLHETSIRNAAVGFFLVISALTSMEVVVAIYLAARYQFNAESTGVLLAVAGLARLMIQGNLYNRIIGQMGEIKILIVGAIFGSFSLVLIGSATSVYLTASGILFLAMAQGVLTPALSRAAALGAPVQRRGASMGMLQLISAISRILLAPIAGYLYDTMSWRSPFYIGSVAMGLTFVVGVIWLFSANQAPSPYLE